MTAPSPPPSVSLRAVARPALAIVLPVLLLAACGDRGEEPRVKAPSGEVRAPVAEVITDIATAPSRAVLLSHLQEMDDLLVGIEGRAPLVRDCRPQRPDAWVLKFDGDATRPAFLLWVDGTQDGATATHWRMQSKVREIGADEAAALHGGRVRVEEDRQRTRRYFLHDRVLVEPRSLRVAGSDWRDATRALAEPGLLALPPASVNADGSPRFLLDGLSATLESCINGQYHLVRRSHGLPESRWFDAAAAALLRATAAPEPMLRAQFEAAEKPEEIE